MFSGDQHIPSDLSKIVLKCTEHEIVSEETSVVHGSFLPSYVSWDSYYEAVETVYCSNAKYMEELGTELSFISGNKELENVKKES